MKGQGSFSLKTFYLISFVVFIIFIGYLKSYPNWERIHTDGYGYYEYLPAAFIYHDLTMKFAFQLPNGLKSKMWLAEYPGKDYRIPKMTAGVAVLMMPFFAIGHLFANLLHYDANGYTQPYQYSIAFAAIFYMLAGLYFLRKSLLCFFSEKVTALVLLIPFFFTNLINYTLWEPSMSHVYSFFLVSLICYLTIQWHTGFKPGPLLGLLFTLGIITLIRPTNLLCALFPLLYGVNDKVLWKQKFSEVFRRPSVLVAGVILFLLPVSLQSFLWKYQTGSWILDSYVGEHFYFNRPHIAAVLVGFRTGWLIYTPVMIFSLIGFYFLYKRRYVFSWSVVLFFFINLYLTSSWWCYWYGGAFGMRPFIDFYAIFLLPLAACMKELLARKRLARVTACLLVCFGLLNLFQQYQFQRGILHYAYMSPRAYVGIFGKTEYPSNYESLLEPDDLEMAILGKPMRKILRPEDFHKKILADDNVSLKASNGKFVCVEAGDNARVVANRDAAYKWETLRMISMEGRLVLLQAWNHMYIYNDSDGVLKLGKYIPKEKAAFTLDSLGGDRFRFRSSNGKYLVVEKDENHHVGATEIAPVAGAIFEIRKTQDIY